MRLVACPTCQTQYDTDGLASAFRCECGGWVSLELPEPIAAPVRRCAGCGGGIDTGAVSCGYCGSSIEYDHRHKSLICPSCYAQNPDEAKFCTACGIAFQPQAHPHESSGVACPDCKKTLVRQTIGSAYVEECPACRGLWVTPEHFDTLVARANEIVPTPASHGIDEQRKELDTKNEWKVTYRRCPTCNGHMQRKNFGRRSGVIVDWCGKHGTWLDEHELSAIAAFVRTGGLEKPKVEWATRGWSLPEQNETPPMARRRSEPARSWLDLVRQLIDG